ncbi:hypothetical protein EVAR_88161_1 [Eumeta japonica]|uniref:Uncharacterized protein n=1 Tax=Eumeta variegata TaxID=151549 RepID=A0A4C1WCT0_EUMVA|nr:hypothetical protein EVAR_88161_1 [Eumeta japonica]
MRRRRSQGQGALNLRIASFAGNSERQSFWTNQDVDGQRVTASPTRQLDRKDERMRSRHAEMVGIQKIRTVLMNNGWKRNTITTK